MLAVDSETSTAGSWWAHGTSPPFGGPTWRSNIVRTGTIWA